MMDLTRWITDEKKESEEKAEEAPKEESHAKEELEKKLPAESVPEEKMHTPENPPWTEKYKPSSLSEIVGNPKSVENARSWAKSWETNPPKKKALLIYGKVGTGKTSLAYALANEGGWEILEMNASDKRSKDIVEQIAGIASQTKSFSGKRRAIIVEEIEGLSGMADRGASQALVKVIKATNAPIIITCNDIREKKLSGIKTYCDKIELKRISPGSIVKRLKEILKGEGIEVEDISVLQKIADNSGGDMRSAVNDLQAVAQGEKIVKKDSIFLEQRDRPIDVYKAMQKIFKSTDYKKCRRIMWDLDEEPRNFVAWLDENIPVEYASAGERARAYSQLSRADIFLGRISNRQYWGFLRYVNDLMTVGVSFSKDKPNFGFSKYRFPSLISMMGRTRGKRSKESSIAAKISPVVHEPSSTVITDYLPLLRKVFSKNRDSGVAMIEAFELEESEVDFLAQ